MVKITNGIVTCEVTSGAYNTIYKAQGFRPVDQTVGEVGAQANQHVEPLVDPFAELVEKPLSQWSKNQVKKFADAKGIDLAGTKNVNEAKERIKAYLESAGSGDELGDTEDEADGGSSEE